MLSAYYSMVLSRMLYIHAYDRAESESAARRFMVTSGYMMVSLVLFITLILWSGQAGMELSMLSVILPGIIPFLKLKQLDQRIKIMKRQIVMELPIFLNKLILLINAGETVQRAFLRCAEKYGENDRHPFAREMKLIGKQLTNLYPLSQVLDECSRRCGVLEMSVFVSAVLMNHKRGGEQFVAGLRQLSHELWEKRKIMVKTLGEEASGRMVFPLLIVFLVVMVIVAAPAIMLMG